jgi:hypothetical protein
VHAPLDSLKGERTRFSCPRLLLMCVCGSVCLCAQMCVCMCARVCICVCVSVCVCVYTTVSQTKFIFPAAPLYWISITWNPRLRVHRCTWLSTLKVKRSVENRLSFLNYTEKFVLHCINFITIEKNLYLPEHRSTQITLLQQEGKLNLEHLEVV